MHIARLGRGVDETGRLDPATTDHAIDAIVEYEHMISRLGVTTTRFVAASVSRNVEDHDDFIATVREVLNIGSEVVEGTEKTFLSFTGAVSSLETDAITPMLVVDIGGGFMELILGDNEVHQAISIDTGAVRVTEKFFAYCSPKAGIPLEDQECATAWIDEQLDAVEKVADIDRVRTPIGVVGTIMTLTVQGLGLAVYQPELIYDARLSLEETETVTRFMVDQPTAAKAALGSMPEGRQDVVTGDTFIRSRVAARVLEKAVTRDTVISIVITSGHGILGGIATSPAWQHLFTAPSLPPSSIDKGGMLMWVGEGKKSSRPCEWKLKRQGGRQAARWLAEKRRDSGR